MTTLAARQRQRRGTLAAGLASTDGRIGELFFCTDKPEILVGTGTGYVPLARAGQRSAHQFSTSSLAPLASEIGSLTCPISVSIYKLETNAPARVRVYLSAAYRTADAARAVSEDPEGDHGLLLEAVTSEECLDLALTPLPTACLEDAVLFWSVENLGDDAAIITTTLNFLSLE